ncbi:MAG: DUF1684 domain-containing protein [Bacteroidia bacterium]
MNLNSRKTSTYLIAAIGAAFLAIILFTQMASNPSSYAARVAQTREQKDLSFKNDPDSPLPREQKAAFRGLRYFQPDESYRVEATYRPFERQDTLRLMTNTGEIRPMLRAGMLAFTLQGRPCEVLVFRYLEPERSNTFFIPFKDLTSGVSTYAGGRYLDIAAREPFFLDFNEAYNPYCVYNDSYTCPFPPRENLLPLEIRAGELDYRSRVVK